MRFKRRKKGVVMVICMIFLSIFCAFAVSMAQMAGANVEIANNHCQTNRALESAQSGLEVVRYWFSDRAIASNLTGSQRFAAIVTQIGNELTDIGAENVSLSYNAVTHTLTVDNVNLDSQNDKDFSLVVTMPDDDHLQADITGTCGEIRRAIRVGFEFSTIGNTVFDFGVATKGPLMLTGQAEIEGKTLDIEASVYIEGDNSSGDAFSITNHASVAGDVSIANSYATYEIGSQASVGGSAGDDAHDHVFVGVPYVDFPYPDPDYFATYATGITIDSSSDWDNHSVLSNVTIAANTNPTFASDVTINGILYIESPNTVIFAGQSVVNGVVVGDGDIDGSTYGSIHFSGQVTCNSVSVLEGEEFEAIQGETGTFIMAPGFSLDFSGQDLNMNGAIAASGISFSGQAGGEVNGSIINYSEDPMLVAGQSSLTFNRSGIVANPSGFVPNHTLTFIAESYSEVN